jgi:chromosome segregation protein
MLKHVRIKGFKSFAGEVTLDLGPGLNVIVGPNGSGKSNFGEAIAWALGEQRAGRLRAPGMADVLYQGSGARPPAGLAEVALQFDGGAGGPTPTELEVGRRLTRAGDSDYRVNGASCRLLDVQETLSTRGLGTESLAVIRQGQVEALATSRPAERRAMLDEAAGVGVAKRRRRRAEQKLARVAEKLDRARDLATELASRGRALERQARAAERAAALEAEISQLREAERAARAVAAAAARDAAKAAHETERAADAAAQAVLDEARERRAATTDARAAAVSTLERAEALAATLRAATDRVGGRAELAQERLVELESRQERLGQARADAARNLLELEEQEAALGDELAGASAGLAAAQAAAHTAEETEITLRGAEIEASEAVRRAGAELAACEGAVVDADRRAAAAQEAVDRAGAALAEARRESPEPLERVELRLQVAERRVDRDRARLDASAAVVEDRTVELRAAEQRQREAAADARRLGADTGDAVRGALGEGLEVEPGLERAVAGAIGAFVDAQVAADLREAQAGIEAGASAVVVPAPARPSIAAPAGARPLRDAIVACPAPVREHVERLLANAWLVDDLAQVAPGQPGVFVNEEGVAFRPADGTVSSTQAAWARKALHRRALALQEEAAAEVGALEPLLAVAIAAREACRRRLLAGERSEARAAERLAAERAVAAARAERLERVAAELAEAERLRADALGARTSARARVDELAAELDAAQQAVGAARDAAHSGAAELERLRTALRDARSTAAAVDARAAGIQAQAAAARALIGAADTLPQDLALVARAEAALADAAARLEPQAESATVAVGEARAAFASAEERLSEAMRAVEAAEAGAGECRERLHRAEVDLRIAEERAAEAGPPPGDPPAEPMDPDELAAKLADLERRRLGIGAVNELAADERAELAAREAHIAEQVRDLEESGAALHTHLGELDAAVGEGFEAIFQAVSERFSEVVGLLFPGGTGRLRLVEPDEEGGDEGVEVEVIPAGKRARALSLMSGGERSLIAMAFCLALAMARPAPFYLLDEVEAALDDANLRRFLGVVRRLADDTQFIVITHQQPTVEVADTLFGVTMGQDGISQVLSRRLAQSVEGPARPYVRRQLRLVNS